MTLMISELDDPTLDQLILQEETDEVHGIVIADGHRLTPQPRISAFIWGGEEDHPPTLPFAHWRPRAAGIPGRTG